MNSRSRAVVTIKIPSARLIDIVHPCLQATVESSRILGEVFASAIHCGAGVQLASENHEREQPNDS